MRFLAITLFLLGVSSTAALAAEEHWQGTMTFAGKKLMWIVTLKKDGDDWSGIIDIPTQSVRAAALEDVRVTPHRIEFSFNPKGATYPAKFSADRTPKAKIVLGTLTQGGAEVPFEMRKLEATPPPPGQRPQSPRPPFPYESRDVSYPNDASELRLAATLTLPDGDGPHPAVILISGAGPQDRDGTIAGHRPFAVIADALSRQGIAVLRVDDRGVGGSTGTVADATEEDLATDIAAGLKFLSQQTEIDGSQLGLLGHGEGGQLAALVASESSAVGFVVMLAGLGLDGRAVLIEQMRAGLDARESEPATRAKMLAAHGELLGAVIADASPADLRAKLRALLVLQGIDKTAMDKIIDQQVQRVTSPWFRSFLAFDPAKALRKVQQPILALNGAVDRQVLAEPNLAAIKTALEAGGNGDITIEKMAGLNHLFQESSDGDPRQYAQIEQTIAPRVLERIIQWIAAHRTSP